MMPCLSPQEQAHHQALIKQAVTIVFDAVNSCGEKFCADAVMAQIEALCGTNSPLRNMAYSVLASVMVGMVRNTAEACETAAEEDRREWAE
jgi:hypothetical protein